MGQGETRRVDWAAFYRSQPTQELQTYLDEYRTHPRGHEMYPQRSRQLIADELARRLAVQVSAALMQ